VFLILLTEVKRIRVDAHANVLYASESDSGAYDWFVSHSKIRRRFGDRRVPEKSDFT
jgi:hypothetical protein